jgi:hypothetical protein
MTHALQIGPAHRSVAVLGVPCNVAFSDAWYDAEHDAACGQMTLDGNLVAAHIAANVARQGYGAGSFEEEEYKAAYAGEYPLALEHEVGERQSSLDEFFAALDAHDESPECKADEDSNFDACYALHCRAHGHGGGPRAEGNLNRCNKSGDADYAARYRARYADRFEYWLGVWRERNAKKTAA